MVVEKKSSPLKPSPQKDGSDSSIKDSVFLVKDKTAEELEIEIQTSRVLYVLDETIRKINIAAHLGHLCQDMGEQLLNFLPVDDVHFIVATCDMYLERRGTDDEDTSGVSTSDATSTRFNDRNLLMKEKSDVSLMQSVDIIYNCPELMAYIEKLDVDVDDLSTSLLSEMVELKSIAKERLSVSASKEREYEKTLKDAWKDNREAQQLIEGLEERLNKQNDELNVQLDAKETLIKMYTEKIDATEQKFKEDIKKRVMASEKGMINNTKHSDEKQQTLSQQAKETTQGYNQLLEQHLAAEKLLRAKRFKVEAQLGGWLEKYDKDIGDRQAELEKMQDQYNSEKAEMDALQAKFDEQEEEYLELMSEKKDYEDDLFNKRYYAFLMNRAARTIQRCWRAYRERKKARRKARMKKKKKGKKGSAEAAPKPEPKPEPPPEDTADIEKEMFGDTEDDGEEEPPPGGEEEAPPKVKPKKGKGKGKGKKKAEKKDATLTRDDDPNVALSKAKLASHVFEEISEQQLPAPPAEVDLNA